MAHHGGLATSLSQQEQQPQVHRPRVSIMTPPPQTTLILQPLSSRTAPQQPPPSEVSLSAPRPNVERTVNEYVDTPFRPTNEQVRKNFSERHLHDPPHHQALDLPINNTVTKQPVTFKKDALGGSSSSGNDGAGTSGGDCFRGSIICPECGCCRCESCRQPRPLPSRWLCNNACFCSAETSLDYASCLCCVKGLFYHCSKDYELEGTGSCADDPCSCGPHRFVARWGCLAALSLVLPCLWCYWPLKGCVGLCEKCYARYTSQGCRCEPRRAPKLSDVTPEKRLLDSSPDF